jgi:HSP20 family molecular chaperone IbpA
MPTDNNIDDKKEKASLPNDPDLNQDDPKGLEDFDEPMPYTQKPRPNTGPVNRPQPQRNGGGTSFEGGLTGFFKGLNDIANFINDLADKAEQAAQGGSTSSQRREPRGRDFNPDPYRGRGALGRNRSSSSVPYTTNNRPAPRPSYVRPATPPVAPTIASNPEMTATVREPYMEIHDEADEGLIMIVAELPGVLAENLKVELLEDILIIRGEAEGYRYEKETLLPVAVQPEPLSRTYQNGLLELRLKKR